jgi:hypothetical protein
MKGILPSSESVKSKESTFNIFNNQTNSKSSSISNKFNSEPSLSSPSSPTTTSSCESPTNSSLSKLTSSKSDLSEAYLMEEACPKKLFRSISRATDNVTIISKARNEFAQDFQTCHEDSQLKELNIETPDFTFTLPDLSIHPEDFRHFLEKDLIEKSTLVSLENAGRLNWWTDLGVAQRLWPLATTGDGNCLLHAASLGWYIVLPWFIFLYIN